MLLFFDTETTGMVDFNMPPVHECQPHLVQVAALLTEDDGTERAHINLIVRPTVPIPSQASAVHGITDEIAEQCGVRPLSGFGAFFALATKVDVLVAHNADFDRTVMVAAGHRVGCKNFAEQIDGMPTFCTMKAATPVCQIESPYRVGEYKWPRLEECIRHFFDEDLEGAHDALVDVRACKRVYFALKSQETAA